MIGEQISDLNYLVRTYLNKKGIYVKPIEVDGAITDYEITEHHAQGFTFVYKGKGLAKLLGQVEERDIAVAKVDPNFLTPIFDEAGLNKINIEVNEPGFKKPFKAFFMGYATISRDSGSRLRLAAGD